MKKRHSAEQVVAMLRQADMGLGKGLKVPEVGKQLGISEQMYYRWRQKYGGMAPEVGKQPRPGCTSIASMRPSRTPPQGARERPAGDKDGRQKARHRQFCFKESKLHRKGTPKAGLFNRAGEQ